MALDHQSVRVKVCGITRAEDATAAVSAGVHALGFVFCQGSPRYIHPKDAAEIIAGLPPFVSAVGVFVIVRRIENCVWCRGHDTPCPYLKTTIPCRRGAACCALTECEEGAKFNAHHYNVPKDRVESIVKTSGIHMIQLHGDESPEECAGYSRPIIRAFRLRQTDPLQALAEFPVAGLLVDAAVEGKWGGTGVPLDWKLLSRRLTTLPNSVRNRLVLAGGLNPENVAEAVSLVEPFGVDVSTGVEDEPGIKNHKKIKEFMDAVRSAKTIGRMA